MMDVDAFLALSPSDFRNCVPTLVSGPIDDAAVAAAIERDLTELIRSFSDSDIASILDAVASIGAERRPYGAHPLIRRAGRIWSRYVLAGSTLEGLEHLLAARAAGPTVVVCNHRAYIDSNAIDTILYREAPSELADRFVSAAGPKVYEGLFRRLASNSLNTIPVPQTASLGHAAKVPAIELARQALIAVAQSHEAMKKGQVLLLFPEGSRTRSGRTQPFLPAVFRYFKLPNTRVVPAALTGTDQVMPVGTRGVHPGPCALRFGSAITVKSKGEARDALEHVERVVSELLPPHLRRE